MYEQLTIFDRFRTCKQCYETYPLSAKCFHAVKGHAGGFKPICRACASRKKGSFREAHIRAEMLCPDGLRVCSRCREYWPPTTKYFHRSKNSKSGLNQPCKHCVANPRHKQRVLAEMLAPEGCKVCTGCLEAKPENSEYFTANSMGKHGLQPQCKDCQWRYRLENKQKLAAYFKERYYKDIEYTRDYRAKRYRENRERILAQNRESRRRQRDTPGFKAMEKRGKAIRRARERQAEGSHTAAELLQMLDDQGGACAYCEAQLEKAWSVDHMIPLSRGGSNDAMNLAITCYGCNFSKNRRTLEEWWEWRKSFELR